MTNLLNVLLMAPSGGEGGGISQFLPLILIVVVFYFFMIRPQMKKQKETKKFRESLQNGDEVVTVGGLYGKVFDVQDTYVMLEIDKGVRVKVDKSAVVKDMSSVAQK